MLSPNYSALVRSGRVTDQQSAVASSTSRDTLFQEIGSYLFFKKRYASRAVSASIMFNPYLVPGFNALFLDDSDAGQSFIAKVQSVTHMMSNQGMSTSVSLAYGRDFDEVDLMTGSAGDPPLPSWFDPDLYGKKETDKKFYNLETRYLGPADTKDKNRAGALGILTKAEFDLRNSKDITEPVVYTRLSEFYLPLIGCESITTVGPEVKDKKATQQVLVTTYGATKWLVNEFITKAKQPFGRDAFIREYITRPIPTMKEAFEFVGAEVQDSQTAPGKPPIPEEYATFVAIKDSKKTGIPGV